MTFHKLKWICGSLVVGALLTVAMGKGHADEIKFSDSANHTTEDLGEGLGLSLKVEKWIEWQYGDYSHAKVLVHWQLPNGTAGSQELYLGISVGDIKVVRQRKTVALFLAGNKYAPEGSFLEIPFKWDAKTKQFVEQPAIAHDPNEDNILRLQRLLDAKKFVQARSLAAQISVSPNGGHTYQTERLFILFLKAVHREASRLIFLDN